MTAKQIIVKSGLVFLVAAAVSLFVLFWVKPYLDSRGSSADNQNIQESTSYELEMVKADLETYGYLSPFVIDQYLKAIQDCYIKYKVPIGLMHAVITIESDYEFWIEHDEVTPKEVGHKVRAIGAAAIVWELWKDTLINNKTATLRTDLFLPYNAIMSAGVILRYLIKDEASKGYSNIVNRVLIRYYGAYLQSRYDKTVKITSELWIKRMNRYLSTLYNTNKDSVKSNNGGK